MLVPGPDIQPTDRECILTTLHAAFPDTTVTVHPRPASIATLFCVHDGAVLRHQLLVPRCVLDDARVKRTSVARMVARAIAEMGQRGCNVVILGGEQGGLSRLRRVIVPPTWLGHAGLLDDGRWRCGFPWGKPPGDPIDVPRCDRPGVYGQ